MALAPCPNPGLCLLLCLTQLTPFPSLSSFALPSPVPFSFAPLFPPHPGPRFRCAQPLPSVPANGAYSNCCRDPSHPAARTLPGSLWCQQCPCWSLQMLRLREQWSQLLGPKYIIIYRLDGGQALPRAICMTCVSHYPSETNFLLSKISITNVRILGHKKE